MAVPQFRGDEQFLPPDDSFPERVAQSLSHFFFVSVNRRAVDVTVSDAQSLLDGPVSFRGFRSPGSQSELRNRVPVFECGVFHNPISLMTECDMQRSYFSDCGSTGRRNIVDGFRDGTEHDGVRAGKMDSLVLLVAGDGTSGRFSRASYREGGPDGSVCGRGAEPSQPFGPSGCSRAVSGRRLCKPALRFRTR